MTNRAPGDPLRPWRWRAQPRRRHRGVRVLVGERNVAGGIDVGVARQQVGIGLHAPIRHPYVGGLEPEVLDVGLAPDAQQKLVVLEFPRFGLGPRCQPAVAARTALNPKCRRTPSRSRVRRKTSPASGTSFGNRLFLAMTRSTSLPSRRKACANLLPIGPPPNTTSLRGSSVSEKTVSLVKYSRSRSPSMAARRDASQSRSPPC